jgi:two-component system LytT family response regulator
MFTAIVVDDDELFCKLVSEMIKRHFPEIKIEGKAHTFYAGIKKIYKYQPSLVFMDMELPDSKGYEIFNMTFPYSFKVIFITAHKDYAYEAINFSPAGYILKPIATGSFINAVLKASNHYHRKNSKIEHDF